MVDDNKENKDKLRGIYDTARKQFDRIYTLDFYTEREQAIEDRLFYSVPGAQWLGDWGRQFENKPRIEVNKIALAVQRVVNDYRNNRITVDFISKEGIQHDPLADTCDMLYRADEQDSAAQEAYDNAFEEAIGGGFGAFRYTTEAVDEFDDENDEQRIRIEPIYDADSSVYFDGNAKKYDKSDAKYVFVVTAWTHEAYKEEFGDDPSSWPKSQLLAFDWYTSDVVNVAEYYKLDTKTDTVYTFENFISKDTIKYRQSDFDNDEELRDKIETNHELIKEKKVKRNVVRKYIMNGNDILEDCGVVAGRHLPIVPVYGKRWSINNVERYKGIVRDCKDAQRLYNMQISLLAENSTYSPISIPIFTPEQISGHENAWNNMNIDKPAYGQINAITDKDGNEQPLGPVGYTKTPEIPQSTAALLQGTSSDIKEILGNPENGEKMQANTSGKAVELIQDAIGFQTFIYLDNLGKSLKRGGEIWLSMATEIYVEKGRKMKGLGSQGEMSSIEVGKPKLDKETGGIIYENEISKATFDVAVDVGPSSSSKRDKTVRTLTAMMQYATDPETLQVLTSLIMMNTEGEGMTEVNEFYRNKMIQMGVTQPTEEERKELEEAAQAQANQPPSPQDQYLQSEAQKADAQAAEARVGTIKTMKEADKVEADTVKVQAETLKTLSEIGADQTQSAITTAQSLDGLLQ